MKAKLVKQFWYEIEDLEYDDILQVLIKWSKIVVSKQNINSRRYKFNRTKHKAHDLSSYKCQVCDTPAECRHHIISIKNGGDNQYWNIVYLCHHCHSFIHPWLKSKQPNAKIIT